MHECKIAETLAELRISKGVKQEDVAQSLSISNKTVSKWENGISMPDIPMVIKLAKYYGVTVDALLGLSENRKQSTTEEICALFKRLDRRESVLKAFETVKALVPALYGMIFECEDDAYDKESVIPEDVSHFYRSAISLNEFFEFVASSENVNIAVMMLRNKSDFVWMNNANEQKEIAKLFKLLSSEDVLSVLYFVFSINCSENFTADYVAGKTGLKQERVTEILDEFCSVGTCSWATAHLAEGEVRVYECHGDDGIILSLITLAFERMCGKQQYQYNIGKGKMIGGKRDEFIG